MRFLGLLRRHIGRHAGAFFRCVNESTPTAKDFMRAIDRPNASFPPEEHCAVSAVSLFADAGDVTLAQKLIPGFKKKRVAQGTLTPPMGVVKNTPRSSAPAPTRSRSTTSAGRISPR